MAWHRQYRPKTIEELDIKQVRDSIKAMMEAGKIPQSLIFAGPKGTGKTSASRILALLLNDKKNEALVDQVYFGQESKNKKTRAFQEPDPDSALAKKVYEGQSFLVNELDAASNRGIDDIRLLKERIVLPPQGAKMAVYILDEVHMLTTEAFNAFLKMLEEPPPHVVFILATTELQKLPATIISRCTVINFQKASQEEIVESLKRVLASEKIKYKEADLLAIAKRADGSFRDAVKTLELACQTGELKMSSIAHYLGQDNLLYIKELLNLLLAKEAKKISQIFEELRNKNVQQKDFYKDLLEFLHDDLLINLGIKKGQAFSETKIDRFLLKEFSMCNLHEELPIAFLALELSFLDIIDRSNIQNKKPGNTDQGKTKELDSTPTPVASKKKILINSVMPDFKDNPIEPDLTENTEPQLTQQQPAQQQATQHESTHNGSNSLSNILPIEWWQKLLNLVAKENFSLSALLKSCRLEEVIDNTAKILVFYDFHKEQLEQQKYQNVLDQSCQQLLGEKIQFNFVLSKARETSEKDLLETAKDVLI